MATQAHKLDELISQNYQHGFYTFVETDTVPCGLSEGVIRMISVMKDDRFKSVNTTWVFWAISDDYGDYAEYRMKKSTQSALNTGKIHEADNVSIWVKTWAQVLEENRTRLQFFQERLEYEADKGASLKHLQEHYAKFLQGVLVEEPGEASTEASSEHITKT